jgi:hypothetical protein
MNEPAAPVSTRAAYNSPRGANGPETGDERDDLVRSLGERTGRKSGSELDSETCSGAGSELVLGAESGWE